MLKITESSLKVAVNALSLTITLAVFFSSVCTVFAGDLSAGPLFDQFPLTIGEGQRTEIFGPFYYNEQNDSENTWALPPFFSRQAEPAIDEVEVQSLYPLFTYVKYGTQYRVQFIELFSWEGGENPSGVQAHRVMIFPIYFRQRSSNTNDNFTAVFPIHGHLKNMLFRDEITFTMFPAYSQTRLRDIVNYNYFYPFVNVRHGDGMSGWQFFPFYGTEHKVVTLVTNNWGEVVTNPGHDRSFVMWPVHFRETNGIGTDNPVILHANIPFYASVRSPKLDSTSVFWPFFNWINNREKKYQESQTPWPIIEFAHGEGKHATRIFPFYSLAYNDALLDKFVVWPIYKYDSIYSPPLDYRRTRICFFLYQNTTEKNTETGKAKRRVDLWPFALYTRDFDGSSRLQILALLESFMPATPGINRNWSPLWSIWRSEKNPAAGKNSQSLLWNLYRRDASPGAKKISCFFGLYQYQANAEGKTVRLFFVPVVKGHTATAMKNTE